MGDRDQKGTETARKRGVLPTKGTYCSVGPEFKYGRAPRRHTEAKARRGVFLCSTVQAQEIGWQCEVL